jgi:hypothetical protein
MSYKSVKNSKSTSNPHTKLSKPGKWSENAEGRRKCPYQPIQLTPRSGV